MAAAIQLESNPETMTKYLRGLGVAEPWCMVDVVGLDEAALATVPRPVLAVVLLFPLSETFEQHRLEQEKQLLQEGAEPQKVFHVKQARSPVCGAVALVHSVANNLHQIQLNDGALKTYCKSAVELDARARGALLEDSADLFDLYREMEGASEAGELTNHYVTFVHKDGVLYELDGRKVAPVPHGPSSPDSLLQDAARVCREFIAKDPGNIGFSVVALVPADAFDSV